MEKENNKEIKVTEYGNKKGAKIYNLPPKWNKNVRNKLF